MRRAPCARDSAERRRLLDFLRRVSALSQPVLLPSTDDDPNLFDVVVWLDGADAAEREFEADLRSIRGQRDLLQERCRELELRCMPYREYLKTPEWAEQRDARLFADDYRCRVCNADEGLQVHHRTYERRGHEDIDDLVTLCRGCHKTFHSARKLARS